MLCDHVVEMILDQVKYCCFYESAVSVLPDPAQRSLCSEVVEDDHEARVLRTVLDNLEDVDKEEET